MFADVIVDIVHTEVDKIFEYSFNNDGGVKLGSRVAVPFGRKVIEGIVIGIKEKSVYPVEKIKPISYVLEDTPALTEETLKLSEYLSKSCFVSRALSLRQFLPSEMRKGRVKEKFCYYAELNSDFSLEFCINSLRKTAEKQKECLLYLSENGKTKSSVLSEKFGASAVKGLNEKGYIIITEEQVLRSPLRDLKSSGNSVKLTEKQQEVVSGIENTDKTVTLLFGVTGSGKTEVYLHLIEDTIKSGKTAIMLVPEISLTPQMLRQLRARFFDTAAILHSGLSAGERFDEWWRIRTDEARIVIGARSAIFAPIENLGLIIIDEEHDGSYSSENAPRYNTVDIAKFRAKLNGAKIVLGSATPSIESFMYAEKGEYNLEELPERINKKPLPQVEIVDMRSEIRRGNNTFFSSALKDELEKTINSGNQAMLFLNQRGYSKFVICTECGNVIKCKSCDVSLTYHKENDSLICHYCGTEYKMVTGCPECGSKYIRYGGFGTEKVYQDLQAMFPNVKIDRMDSDTTKNKKRLYEILDRFSKKETQILIGTQMIAKGHDFPSVTLVGILDADMSLHFSDYRSAERTFELITQVAGRSGRASEPGKVVLQTYSPENETLSQAIKYDYLGFYKSEISIRKATAFPPFCDIVRVLISAENEEDGLAVTKAVKIDTQQIYEENREKFRFFGCMKAPIKRIQNKFRYQVLMRIEKGNEKLIEDIYKSAEKYNGKGAFISFEINPNNLN